MAKLPFVGVAVGFFGSRHTSAFMGFRRQRARQRKVSFWLAAARPVETFRARVFRRGEGAVSWCGRRLFSALGTPQLPGNCFMG